MVFALALESAKSFPLGSRLATRVPLDAASGFGSYLSGPRPLPAATSARFAFSNASRVRSDAPRPGRPILGSALGSYAPGPGRGSTTDAPQVTPFFFPDREPPGADVGPSGPPILGPLPALILSWINPATVMGCGLSPPPAPGSGSWSPGPGRSAASRAASEDRRAARGTLPPRGRSSAGPDAS